MHLPTVASISTESPMDRPKRPKAGPTLSGLEGVINKRGERCMEFTLEFGLEAWTTAAWAALTEGNL